MELHLPLFKRQSNIFSIHRVCTAGLVRTSEALGPAAMRVDASGGADPALKLQPRVMKQTYGALHGRSLLTVPCCMIISTCPEGTHINLC